VLELVLLVPAFLVMIYLIVGLGRLTTAREDIDGAARDAARAGSLGRSADEARASAEDTAARALGSHDITCDDLQVEVDTSEFRAGGWVRVDLSCTVGLADLTGTWAPGSKTLRAHGLAVVDTFRRAA
jgi:Flp pilus assembly protein TadG